MPALNQLAAADQATIGAIAVANGAVNTDAVDQSIGGVKTFTGQLIGKGTTTNDSAATGYIGEWVSTKVVAGSAVALTSATAKDVVTASLAPGEYDVRGGLCLTPNTLSNLNQIAAGFSTTANTLPTAGSIPGYVNLTVALNAATDHCVSLAETRFSLAATTTVRLVGLTNYTGTGVGGYGVIEWRRVR